MRTVFADTVFWVAAANPRDQWADTLRRLEPTLADTRILTTDEILVELLSHFSGLGSFLRQKAAEIARAVLRDPNVTVVPQNRDSFLRGLTLYESRSDKGYRRYDQILGMGRGEEGQAALLLVVSMIPSMKRLPASTWGMS